MAGHRALSTILLKLSSQFLNRTRFPVPHLESHGWNAPQAETPYVKQGCSLHSSSSLPTPLQLLFEQVRTLYLTPPPHVTVHFEYGPQTDQVPSHGRPEHGLCSKEVPLHLETSSAFESPFMQIRVFTDLPRPQVTEHVDHCAHSP